MNPGTEITVNGSWRIRFDGEPRPRSVAWSVYHEDFDGPPDSRGAFFSSIEECVEFILDSERKEANA